ncbi:MAG: hypothetical protein L3K23_08445 [Thermoplasmata archaeon]|nr:hypothetical protein [Thermoplasmata archaeon]
MTTIRTLATHEIIELIHPRVVSVQDEVGMAVGSAIDGALSAMSYEARTGRRPSIANVERRGQEILEEHLRDAELLLEPAARAEIDASIRGVIVAFRQSDLLGRARPKSRLILIDEKAGVYAQPDYWDGGRRFYEMKSYRAVPPRPDVLLQLELFQLAFPECQGELVCFDRHARPVEVTRWPVPPVPEARRQELLTRCRDLTLQHGEPKVLEYVDNPAVRYAV